MLWTAPLHGKRSLNTPGKVKVVLAMGLTMATAMGMALTKAKAQGGSWEKASKVELIGDAGEGLGASSLGRLLS